MDSSLSHKNLVTLASLATLVSPDYTVLTFLGSRLDTEWV